MESPSKAETKKGAPVKPRGEGHNESDEDVTPPGPIDIASEPPDFGFPDAQELRRIESDTQNRLKAILEVAGVTGLTEIDARTFQDPEILRKLTNRYVNLRALPCHVTGMGLGEHLGNSNLRVFFKIKCKYLIFRVFFFLSLTGNPKSCMWGIKLRKRIVCS